MPSDPVLVSALRALSAPIEHYRSAVATTLEEVRGYLAAHRSGTEGRASQLAAELGLFARGHIDAARLALVLGEEETLDSAALHDLQQAFETLASCAAQGEGLFHVEVKAGGDVTSAVSARLEEAGRAFAAARLAALASKRQSSRETSQSLAIDGFGFSRWTAGERRLAPPVIVSVSGGDVRVGGLADLLDGAQKIVLIVDGECPPAPLARLITPNTLVVQTDSVERLERLGAWQGPAVAAVLPASAARFVHDPAGGSSSWQRLTVEYLPEPPRRAVGGLSAAQQAEDLRQLAALATPPVATPAVETPSAPPPPSGDPIDRLAAWLLHQANLSDVR
jgi:hypothetical protein